MGSFRTLLGCKTGFVHFWALQIPWPSETLSRRFQVFYDLRFSCHTFKKLNIFPCFEVFFDLTQLNRHKLWCWSKCVPFMLFNYSSLSEIILLLTSAVTNLPHITLIFHNFPGLENEKFHGFPGFPWPVRIMSKIIMWD